jgi:hypothetical protein
MFIPEPKAHVHSRIRSKKKIEGGVQRTAAIARFFCIMPLMFIMALQTSMKPNLNVQLDSGLSAGGTWTKPCSIAV